MTKAENDDWQVARFEIGDTEVEIVASESKLVRVILGEETTTNIHVFTPDEAERVAQGMLKAVEHIRTKEAK